MRQLINRAMHQSDDLVVTFDTAMPRERRRTASSARSGSWAKTAFWPCASAARNRGSSTWIAARTCGWRGRRIS